MEICAAGMLEMFQSKFAETLAHGSSGLPHFSFSLRILFSFWRMVLSFALPDEGGTDSPWIVRASARYS